MDLFSSIHCLAFSTAAVLSVVSAIHLLFWVKLDQIVATGNSVCGLTLLKRISCEAKPLVQVNLHERECCESSNENYLT